MTFRCIAAHVAAWLGAAGWITWIAIECRPSSERPVVLPDGTTLPPMFSDPWAIPEPVLEPDRRERDECVSELVEEDLADLDVLSLFEDESSPFSLFDAATYPAANLPTFAALVRYIARDLEPVDELEPSTDDVERLEARARKAALDVWRDPTRREAWVDLCSIHALSMFVAGHAARVNDALERGDTPRHLAAEIAHLGPFLATLSIDPEAIWAACDEEAARVWDESNGRGLADDALSSLAPEAKALQRLLTQSAQSLAVSAILNHERLDR